MAQFRGTLQGNRGETSRLGSKKSGLKAQLNGWNIGCDIEIHHEDGVDKVKVYKTSGSNGAQRELVTEFQE